MMKRAAPWARRTPTWARGAAACGVVGCGLWQGGRWQIGGCQLQRRQWPVADRGLSSAENLVPWGGKGGGVRRGEVGCTDT